MDLTRPLGWLDVSGLRRVVLGGRDAARALTDHGAAGYSAELLGGAARVLEMTTEYAKERVQFGKPIGSFQAVKHRCADMLVDVEGMRSVAYYAAWCIASGDPDASVAASTAKVWCSDAAKRVMASGLQVHGGIGFTWEHDLHLYLKRAQLSQLCFGDATYHRQRLAALLRPRVEAGEPLF
jgi:alkylation response protein AidB-like acyl-CoA dehydrogenase